MEEERIYEHTSNEALDIITQGLQVEQRELNRLYSAVLNEKAYRYASMLRAGGYETEWGK
jgi:transcriptional regulator GlxA family with amidase domain